MESLLEAELYKRSSQELSAISTRIGKLILEALAKQDRQKVEELQRERAIVSQVMKTKERIPVNEEE